VAALRYNGPFLPAVGDNEPVAKLSGLARSESAMTAHLSATLHAALSTPPKYLPEQRYSYETIFQDSHSLELQAEPDL
jgi:hypothetical protein